METQRHVKLLSNGKISLSGTKPPTSRTTADASCLPPGERVTFRVCAIPGSLYLVYVYVQSDMLLFAFTLQVRTLLLRDSHAVTAAASQAPHLRFAWHVANTNVADATVTGWQGVKVV